MLVGTVVMQTPARLAVPSAQTYAHIAIRAAEAQCRWNNESSSLIQLQKILVWRQPNQSFDRSADSGVRRYLSADLSAPGQPGR